MPTPTLSNISPATGPAGGRTLVELRGSGFRLPPAPPATGFAPAPGPTVAVEVAGRLATDVRVLAEGRLTCLTPAGSESAATVVVRNVDDSGAAIPGEEAALATGFTYALGLLTPESDLARLVRTLIRELKRQVLENVVLTVQTDYDEDTGEELHLAQIAEYPALTLVGPELAEDRFFSLNRLPEVPAGPDGFIRRRVPYTVDLGFTLVGASDHTLELLNLMVSAQLFFHRNKFLEMDRDPTDPSAGRVRYEMDFTPDGDLKVASQPNESNVRSFSGKFVIRGFDLEDLAGFVNESVVERGVTVESVIVESQQTLPSLSVGWNPDP
jgi:hypothetical protein